VLDRDALPVNVLQNLMGWKRIARIWLPSWRVNADELVEDIFDLATAVSLEPAVVEPVVEPVEIEEVVDVNVSSIGLPPVVTPAEVKDVALPGERSYIPPSPVSEFGTVAELEALSPKARDLLHQMVEYSGPMLLERAVKLTASAFGLSVVRDVKLAKLIRLVKTEQVITTEFGDFVFPSETVGDSQVLDSFTWFRKSNSAVRRVQDIAPHELANLFVALVRSGFSMSRDELVQESLTFLGYNRKTGDTSDFVHRVINWAVENDYLIDSEDRLSAP
jgi:hypothetical protein